MMLIREATSFDRDAVANIHEAAFAEDERDLVRDLAVALLTQQSTPPSLSFVAENDGVVVAHVAFSPMMLADNPDFRAYILAPLAVKPDYQHRHIGSELIKNGMKRLSEMGIHYLFVYGDPAYYGRFGFKAEAVDTLQPPYPLQYPLGWQSIALNDSVAKPAGTLACVEALCDSALW
jgi:putative acetyltransferase